MSRFDQADRQASSSFDTELGDALSYQPTVPERGGYRITISKGENIAPYKVDPSREARPRPGETGFVAIITWRTYAMSASDLDSTHRDVLMANDVMIDISRQLFQTPDGEKLPRTGDIFWLPGQHGTLKMQQTREPLDDGGDRIVLFCIAPNG